MPSQLQLLGPALPVCRAASYDHTLLGADFVTWSGLVVTRIVELDLSLNIRNQRARTYDET